MAVPDGLKPDKDWAFFVGPMYDRQINEPRRAHRMGWTYEVFPEIFIAAGFRVELLEYWDGFTQHYTDWDVQYGLVRRSRRFDERNKNGDLTAYSSLIIDIFKSQVDQG